MTRTAIGAERYSNYVNLHVLLNAVYRRYVFGLFGHLRISAYQRFSISMTPFQMFLVQMDVRIRVNAFLRASQ